MVFVQLVFFAVVTLCIYLWIKRLKNFPPGPRYLPLIGTIASLYSREAKPIHEMVNDLSGIYGPLVGLFLGPRACIAVNGYTAVKHVLSREDCALRPDGIMLRARSFNKRLGILFSDGPLWKEHRRFTLRHLRDFGFGKRSMEGLIHEEIATLLKNLEIRMKNSPEISAQGIDIQDLFPVSVINILWAIMAGVRYDHNNNEFKILMHNVNEFFRNGSPTGGIMIIPFLRYVPIINSSFKKQMKSVYVLQGFVKNILNNHMATYQADNMRDFIDMFIQVMKSQAGDKNSTFTEEQLIVLCMDLFLAGTETTSGALSYIFLYLILYPEVQKKIKDEINSVVGKDRLPSIEDAANLHYVQATTSEVLRHACMVPFTPPHITASDTKLFGYDVPKGTFLMVNLYSVFMEKDYWGDPEVFRPERFLDANGVFVKDEHLLLFGYGPRFCLGEPLARNSTFLFLTSILQRFSFSLPTDSPPPSMDHLQGFTTSPRPYKVAVVQD